MKKVLLFLGVLLISLSSYSQIVVNQSVSTGPYKVGDTITVTYSVDKGTTKPRYFWLRYQFNNKALAYVSTTFTQGTQSQTYYTGWNNYKFTPAANVSDTSLYAQYQLGSWAYTTNVDWNVGQLSVQRADQSVNGVIATQKYVVKDQNTYSNIHKLDLAYATDSATGAYIPFVKTTSGPLSLSNVTGNTSYFKVSVLFPSSYTTITDHNIQLMKLKNDGSGNIDWSQQPIASLPLDASGEALFTTQVKVGDSVGVFVTPAWQKIWMNNIVTVSDAYKAFLAISQVDINGNPTYYTYPNLEKHVGGVSLGDTTFNETDAYYLFSYVMGQNMSSVSNIPTATAQSIRWMSGLLNQSWLDGTPKYRVYITQPTQIANAVFAWGGDLDWSHSSSPSEIASRVASGNVTNAANSDFTIKSMAVNTYSTQLEDVKLGITSTIENGKVILTSTLSKTDLAGLQVVMNYDSTKLTLDNVIFDAGSTITNFSTHDNGRLTFGSIDQLKTARIKAGTPYKLVFTPKTPLTNTAGLFFFVLADAVDGTGKKINLIIE